MKAEEKRFLQAALAYLGYYSGVLDGQWGRRSQEALDAFAVATGGREATNLDAVVLMMTMRDRFALEGWECRHFDHYDISIFVPTADLKVDNSDAVGLALDHPTAGVSIYLRRDVRIMDMVQAHNWFTSQHDGSTDIYQLRDPYLWVTAATWGGLTQYMRSENVGAGWTSIGLTTQPSPASPVNLVAGSITRNPQANVTLPKGGYAERQITAVAAILDRTSDGASSMESNPSVRSGPTPPALPAPVSPGSLGATPAEPTPPPPASASASGTGLLHRR